MYMYIERRTEFVENDRSYLLVLFLEGELLLLNLFKLVTEVELGRLLLELGELVLVLGDFLQRGFHANDINGNDHCRVLFFFFFLQHANREEVEKYLASTRNESKKIGYLQFAPKVVHLAVQVRYLQRSTNIGIKIHVSPVLQSVAKAKADHACFSPRDFSRETAVGKKNR